MKLPQSPLPFCAVLSSVTFWAGSILRGSEMQAMGVHSVAVRCVILLAALVSGERAIPRPTEFYGSDALLDGYCDEAQYFTDVFTLPSERLMVEGSASDVTRSLAATNETGELLQLYSVN